MARRVIGWLALVVVMVTGLWVGPDISQAQTPPALPQVFTWQPYGLSVSYPETWVAQETSGVVSLHPADRNVGDGLGPEMILFTVPDTNALQLDIAIFNYSSTIKGQTTPVIAGQIDGHVTRTFTYSRSDLDTLGAVLLISVDDQTTVGAAYVVRDSEAALFQPMLEAMFASLTLAGGPIENTSPDLAVYQDATYGYSLSYPGTWQLFPDATPGAIHLQPPDVTINSESGPEFVVVVLTNLPDANLDRVLADLLAGRPGTFSAPLSSQIGTYATRFVSYENTQAVVAFDGAIFLVQLDTSVVLAMGYRAPAAEFPNYEKTFEAIRKSASLPAVAGPTAGTQVVSQSVASIQLPQRVNWLEGGLTLYLPQDWTYEIAAEDGYPTLTAQPESTTGSFYLLKGSTVSWLPSLDLRTVVEQTLAEGQTLSQVQDIVAAGYQGVVYDIRDTAEEPELRLRALLLAIPERKIATLIAFGAEQTDWDMFRPMVDAMLASLEPAGTEQSFGPNFPIRAQAMIVSPNTPVPLRQEDPWVPFEWEEYGVTLLVPPDWQVYGRGADYDLVLLSPDAQDSDTGAYITLQHITSLGSDTPETALQALAEQVGASVEALTVGNVSGAQIHYEDEEAGVQWLILLPYGDEGEMFYFQAGAMGGQDADVQTVIESYTATPPTPDEAAINAAWQTSLADSGRLVYGDPDAPVSMLEVFDFSCGHCANYHADINRLMALEVEPGRANFEWVITGWSDLSFNATEAVLCATEQGAGYSAYKTLFKGYIVQGRDYAYSREGSVSLLAEADLGLDIDALNTCLDEGKYTAIREQMIIRSQELGIRGTPSVLFATGGNTPAFLMYPGAGQDGPTEWSGVIPIDIVRMVVQALIDGTPLENVFTVSE